MGFFRAIEWAWHPAEIN